MAELHVSKKSISKLFSEMQGKKFIIPDYQRPYKWNIEKCETLWNDIENFTQNEAEKGNDYFLGTIVTYKNGDNQEIIDGQQRITSFFLLLRAFYSKLEDMNAEDEDVMGLKRQIAPCIWDINPISQKVSDYTKIHIQSLVATEADNATFHDVLETGQVEVGGRDNYSRNYDFFKRKCDEYATSYPMQWKEFCITILQKCIILPIECDAQDTALTIFSTLNDRGMPLADSDIFKAQLYRNAGTDKKREKFTNTWKELMQICKQGDFSIDDIFRYYSHVLRGRAEDKSKEVGLRKFYAAENYKRLKKKKVMKEIMYLANFWRYIKVNKKPAGKDDYNISLEAQRYLHCLQFYPNDFWKYATSTFFIKNRKSETFEKDFTEFLKELIAFLFAEFIQKPTVNAIKDDIYTSCVAIIARNQLQYKIDFEELEIRSSIDDHHSSRLSRALLLLDAYLNEAQINCIPNTFDIEHIFPKKWQDTNYNGWEKSAANEYLDRLGNKIVLEKKINIQAGNGYFGRKKEKYGKSKIASVLDLSQYAKNDWTKVDIEAREEGIKDNLINFFKKHLNLS